MPRTDTSIYWLFNFQDGILTDTSYFIQSGKVKEKYVFENNDLRVVEKCDYSNINTIHSHQEYLYGLEHGKHKWYGLLGTSTIILYYEWDKYDGKLSKEMIYDNGQLLEEIEYKKNGTKARHKKFQLHTKYPFVERKECE